MAKTVRVNAAEFADKQATRLKSSINEIRMGINAVTENPMQKAADNDDKWILRLQESRAKWKANTAAVTLDDWKTAAIHKGVDRIASGIDAARPKVIAFATRVIPYINNLLQTIDAMPDTTLEDSISRMTEFTRGMAKFSNEG